MYEVDQRAVNVAKKKVRFVSCIFWNMGEGEGVGVCGGQGELQKSVKRFPSRRNSPSSLIAQAASSSGICLFNLILVLVLRREQTIRITVTRDE